MQGHTNTQQKLILEKCCELLYDRHGLKPWQVGIEVPNYIDISNVRFNHNSIIIDINPEAVDEIYPAIKKIMADMGEEVMEKCSKGYLGHIRLHLHQKGTLRELFEKLDKALDKAPQPSSFVKRT